jgi:hypothetical protein
MSINETDAARSFEDREPQAIEHDIDATRADMRATLDALERRWSVDRLVDLTVGRIRERGGGFAGNLTDAATQNPLPLLLTSIGVGWMMLASRRGARPDYSAARDHERAGGIRDSAANAAGSVRDAMQSARDSVQHAAESSREKFEHTAESLRSGAESLRGSAGRAAAATRDQVHTAQARMDRLLEEQPLMLGVFGLAAGAIIGALLPTSEHEDRLFGEVRDKAVKTVAAKARDGYEGVRDNIAAHTAPGGDGAAGERPASRPH